MRYRSALVALSAICIFVISGVAMASSFSYSGHRKEIRAGVLMFKSGNSYSRITNPYTFYVMDQRTDLKPSGWEFTNPLAPSRVTDDMIARWSTSNGPAYSAAQQVTKDMGCYWEVPVDAPFSELAKFDVLLVNRAAVMTFSRQDKQKMRKLADAGGVVWVGNAGGGIDAREPFFLEELTFTGGPGGPVSVPNPAHPLLREPYGLSWEEANALGLRVAGAHTVRGQTQTLPDERYFASLILAGNKPVVSVAQYGSGHVAAVAENVAAAISLAVGDGRYAYAGNTGQNFLLAQTEDLKFAFNMVNWAAEYTTYQKGPRHTGRSFQDLGAVALKWGYPTKASGSFVSAASPAFLNDMVFFVDGTAGGSLHAFDLTPGVDRNGDGDPDDGIKDYSNGAPYDELWVAASIGPCSSPTAAYVQFPGGQCTPAVFVTTQDGRVLAFDANAGGNPTVAITVGSAYPADTVEGKVNIPAPTFVDGVLYVGGPGPNGTLHARDYIRNGTWNWPTNPALPSMVGPALNSPTVGYFRNPITGSIDQVLYLACRGVQSSVDGPVCCFPMKVFGEVLRKAGIGGDGKTRYTINSPFAAVRQDAGSYRIYYVRQDGALQDITDDLGVGAVQPPSTFLVPDASVPFGSTIVADYEVDMGLNGSNPMVQVQPRQRITIKVPPPTGGGVNGIGVVSSPAAGTNDLLYYAAENGSLYAAQESGRGAPIIKWRWYLGDVNASALLQGNAIPFGSPAVDDDTVYFATNIGADGCILAFKANPTFILNVGAPIDSRRPVEVLQFDRMNPMAEPVPIGGSADTGDSDISGTTAAYRVDYNRGRITVTNFRDPRNSATELSAAADVIVRFYRPESAGGTGVREEQIHSAVPGMGRPDDQWNNLKWFARLPGTTITSSPVLMGGTLLVGCSRGQAEGVVTVLDAGRINEKVAGNIGVFANGLSSPNEPPLIWDVDPITGKMLQPGQRSTAGPVRAAVAGANGMLAVASASGLSVLYDARTLIADSHRLLEVNANGGIVWSCESTTTFVQSKAASGGGDAYASVPIPFNRPNVARKVGTGTIVVADTGNNRVVQIDKSGKVLWQIADFVDPRKYPAGTALADMVPNDRLNEPTDVSMWSQPVQGSPWPEYHYLIADPGNYRVVEIAVQYDQATNTFRNVLYWSTRTLEQGKRYRYMSAWSDFANGARTALMCIVGNYQPTAPDTAQPLDPSPDLAPAQIGHDRGGMALVSINTLQNPDPRVPGSGDPKSGLIDAVVTKLKSDTGAEYPLFNPTSFDRQYRTATRYYDAITDAKGIYVVEHDGGDIPNIYAYNSAAYLAATGVAFSPAYARFLPSHNLMVTNRASGRFGTQEIHGEIVEFDPSDWTIVNRMSAISGSYKLEQPCSAERQ